jgi:hypothetical protein
MLSALDILIYRQNLYAPRSRRFTVRREAQGREPVNKGKNLPVLANIRTDACSYTVKVKTNNFFLYSNKH